MENSSNLFPRPTMSETLSQPEQTQAEPLSPEAIRGLQLEASRMQLRLQTLTTEERSRYEDVMTILRQNNADDWGD